MADPWRQTATLTILSGQTSSEELNFAGNNVHTTGLNFLARTKVLIQVMAPATLPETVNLQVAPVAGGSYRIQRSGGTAIALGAGFADQIGPVLAGAMKLVATGAVAANRVFEVIIEPA